MFVPFPFHSSDAMEIEVEPPIVAADADPLQVPEQKGDSAAATSPKRKATDEAPKPRAKKAKTTETNAEVRKYLRMLMPDEQHHIEIRQCEQELAMIARLETEFKVRKLSELTGERETLTVFQLKKKYGLDSLKNLKKRIENNVDNLKGSLAWRPKGMDDIQPPKTPPTSPVTPAMDVENGADSKDAPAQPSSTADVEMMKDELQPKPKPKPGVAKKRKIGDKQQKDATPFLGDQFKRDLLDHKIDSFTMDLLVGCGGDAGMMADWRQRKEEVIRSAMLPFAASYGSGLAKCWHLLNEKNAKTVEKAAAMSIAK